MVTGRIALDRLPRLRQSQAAGACSPAAVDYRLEGFVDERGRPSARLHLSGAIDLQCDRCGAPLRWTLQSAARYYFVADERELARLPVEDTEEEPLLGSARFDLHGLVEDEAILALPMSPRHAACEPPPAPAQVEPSPATEAAHPFAQLEKLRSRRH